MAQMTSTFVVSGGLNLVTPPLAIPPGQVIAALNYEPIDRGYARVDGYERYDGQPKPSEASYWILNFDAGSSFVGAGFTITGATSGATGKLLIDPVVSSGTWGGGNAAGYFVLTGVTGTFQDNEALQLSAVTRALANGVALENGAATDTLDETYSEAAIEAARALIGAVPGSGPVRGVHVYADAVWAFRDNAGGTAGVLHKATAAGWVAQSFGSTLDFDGGVVEIPENDTLTGFTSGATATAKRVVLQAGTYSGLDAAGYLVTGAITGTFQDNEVVYGSTEVETFLANGVDAAATLIRFDAGTVAIQVGMMLIGGTSTARAQVTDLVLESGTWAGGDAKGYATLGTVSGGPFQSGETLAGRAQAVITNDTLPRKQMFFDNNAVANFVGAETITGSVSAATATVNQIVTESGTFGAGNGKGYLIVTVTTGTFVDAETITGGTSGATARVDGGTLVNVYTVPFNTGDGEIKDGQTIVGATSGVSATVIDTVTTSGSWTAGTAAGFLVTSVLSKRMKVGETIAVAAGAARAAGANLSLRRLDWDAGEAAVSVGTVVKGKSSGARGIVSALYRSSGQYLQGNAVGYVLLASVSGAFTNNEQVVALPTVTADGTAAAITLPAGGRYEAVNHNFKATADTERMYFVNGVGRAHEWDGTVLAPIRAVDDAALDKPNHVAVHAKHLFLAYARGSLQHSGIADPLNHRVLEGAGEIGFGHPITGLLENASTSMIVFGEDQIGYIAGTDTTTFVLAMIADASGAVEWTAQLIGSPGYLDAGGVRRLDTTQAFGDWKIGALSAAVDPVFKSKADAGRTVQGALRCRAKDHYRLFWDDGSGITIYIGAKIPAVLPFALDVALTSFGSGKIGDTEILLAGATSGGMVYELDAGTSFDGEPVAFFCRFPFNAIGTPSQKKRYHKATVELDGTIDTTIGLVADYDYGAPDPAAYLASIDVNGGGGFWDEVDWNEFYWSAQINGTAEAHLDGIGRNISITIVGEQTYEAPHVLTALMLNFSYRGQVR